MVSVVMPYYNTALDLTHRALQSVADQGEVPLEVLIVDDGSQPESARGVRGLAREFQAALQVRLLHQANAGPGVARNRGVAEASYDLVAFLDSDDFWLPNSLPARLELLRRDDAAWMVCGGARVEDTEGVLVARNWGRQWEETFSGGMGRLYLSLFRVNRVNNSTVCLRKGPFQSLGGFDGELENSEDYDLWFRACRAGLEMRYLDGPLATLVHHGANFSKQVGRRRRAEATILCRELADPPPFLKDLPRRLVDREVARAWFRVGRYQESAGQREPARRAFARSFARRPHVKTAWRWAWSRVGL